MDVTVHLSATLRAYCDHRERSVVVAGATLRDVLVDLGRSHPDLHTAVCDETGAVRQHVHLFVNDTLATRDIDRALGAGDEVFIMPAVSGG